MHMRKPIIGIPADRRLLGSHWFHCVGEKYIDAVVQAADAVPVLVPALGERYLREWLASFDGILFTGSPSNVEPHRYLGPQSAPGTWHDPERDATTLPMITGALDAGLNVIDTAECYEDSEALIGRAARAHRSELYLFTKCGHGRGWRENWRPAALHESIERSLRHLRTDHLDLIQLHSCSLAELRRGEVITALERARARGVAPEEYFKDNLLRRETTALDVARAFAFLATADATTGAVVTVDGGNPAAFPR